MARFEDLGLVSPPASSSLLTISRIRPSTFTVEVIRAPTYTVGITIGETALRRPSGNREVGTLSDSALEPSSRRPAPSHYIMARFEDLGLVSPPASSSLLTISRIRPSTFTVEVIRVNER